MTTVLIAKIRELFKDQSGLSAVEYGLLAAGIAVGLWGLIHSIGLSLQDIYTSVGTDLSQAD